MSHPEGKEKYVKSLLVEHVPPRLRTVVLTGRTAFRKTLLPCFFTIPP